MRGTHEVPLPSPTSGEQHDNFIPRCMADGQARRDFPSEGQRRAVCEQQWDTARKRNTMTRVLIQSENPPEGEEIEEVLYTKGITLEVRPNGDILAVQFSEEQFPDPDSISHFLGDTVLYGEHWPSGDVSDVRLHAGATLGYRRTHTKAVEVQLTDEELVKLGLHEFVGQTALAVKGIPITPGTHNGLRFTREMLNTLRGHFVGLNVAIDHEIDRPSDMVGRVVDEGLIQDEMVITALILDEDAQKRVRSGELHSFSSHFMVRFNKTEDPDVRDVVKIFLPMVEQTLTGDPADPSAVILVMADVPIPMPFNVATAKNVGMLTMKPDAVTATTSTVLNTNAIIRIVDPDQTPETETSKNNEGGLENLTEQETVPTPEAPAPSVGAPSVADAVDTSPAELSEVSGSGNATDTVQLRQEVDALRADLVKEREAREQDRRNQAAFAAQQRVKEVSLTVERWVQNGNIPKAVEKEVGDLLASATADQRPLVESIFNKLKIDPMGQAESNSAGLVPSESDHIDYSKMTNRELEMQEYAEAAAYRDATTTGPQTSAEFTREKMGPLARGADYQ